MMTAGETLTTPDAVLPPAIAAGVIVPPASAVGMRVMVRAAAFVTPP